ncbi:MAG TPA: hypothetical protein VFW03_00940 [Gemmatimonadaceae bacterium]|nr:hypothetical protein [Gemmatimonadaceae bacterium]
MTGAAIALGLVALFTLGVAVDLLIRRDRVGALTWFVAAAALGVGVRMLVTL